MGELQVGLDPVSLAEQSAGLPNHDWSTWIEKYANGEFPMDEQPPPPALDALQSPPPILSPEDEAAISLYGDVCDLGNVNPAATMRSLNYLSAPVGPYEGERRKVLQRYGLKSIFPGRKAIDQVADMAKAFYRCPIVVISVVLDDREIFASTIGWDETERAPGFRKRIEIPLASALCPHAMTKLEGEGCFVLENTAKDWRFARNPYCSAGGPIAFFASANIYLPTALSEDEMPIGRALPSKLPIGSVCIVDTVPREAGAFTRAEADYLTSCADMVAREIELGYQRDRQRVLAQQTSFLGNFLATSLVHPSWECREDETPPEPTVEDAAIQLCSLIRADTVAFLDLRSFQAGHLPALTTPSMPATSPVAPTTPRLIRPSNSRNDSQASVSTENSMPSLPNSFSSSSASATRDKALQARLRGRAHGFGVVSVLASSRGYNWEKVTDRADASEIVSNFFAAYRTHACCQFGEKSPLASLLPQGTTASLAVPIFDVDGQPALLAVASSAVQHFRFESTDREFVESIGGIAVASLLRQRILEADRAKLAFLSAVSHELLTPLHGVRGQLELIRAITPASALQTINPLLEVAEVCVGSLREILDNTLDFSKSSHAEGPVARQPVSVDLEDVVEQVIKACWARMHEQAMAVRAPGEEPKKAVDIILDYQLPPEQKWLVDIGGLKRLLFNLCGNSLKFTAVGSVRITLKPAASCEVAFADGSHLVEIIIADTGRGMSRDFIRDHLFVPFKQADSFSQGAGLGVSICDQIIQRMRGTMRYESALGVGTSVHLILPLHHSGTSEASNDLAATQLPFTPRVISDELAQLLRPNPSVLSLSGNRPSAPSRGLSRQVSALSLKLNESLLLPVAPALSNPFELRVLVVEDNAVARRILTMFLTKKKIRWAEAEDGVEGVEKFQSFRPNLVWCDIQMPRLDGIGATAAMRHYETSMTLLPAYIVALSGLSSELSRNSGALESGQIDRWIVKGGPTLKELGAGMDLVQEDLTRRRNRLAEFEAAMDDVRKG